MKMLRLCRGWVFGVMCCVFVGVAGGCGELRLRHPVPRELSDRATLPGMSDSVRTWGDAMSAEFVAGIAKSREQTLTWYQAHPEERPATVDLLALSGGGADGAYGAGLLYGWGQAGTRPKFRLVTGVSTGALIAPFAFLGTAYDEKLKAAYTTVKTEDIYVAKKLLDIVGSDAATDNRAMVALLTKWVDADLIRAVAEEHAKGRRLYVATVNLDAQRLVIWDMGAIASSGDARAADLFRSVMQASASIPVAFPPVYLNVTADGKVYDEMHVDGGAISQTFLWDAGLSMADVQRQTGIGGPIAPVRLFIIRNSQLKPQWEGVKPKVSAIGKRSIATLLKSEGMGDLYRIYAMCQRDGFDYNVAHIPDNFSMAAKEAFDMEYMKKLFEVGYQEGRGGYKWVKTPFDLSDKVERKAADAGK